MKKKLTSNHSIKLKHLYKCEIYNPLPDKIIEEMYIRAFSQLEAKEKAFKNKKNENILLITAQKIEIYE